MTDPFVLPAPAARAALTRGMDLMTRLLRPTLGPTPRTVAIARAFSNDPPEVLDNAATIARRTVQLACPYEDMGGMIVRQLVWTVYEAVGDGTATAAVLAQGLAREADRAIAAGWHPMILKQGIERGLAVVLAALRRQARSIELPAEIAGVVTGSLRDARLAEMIGEIIDSVGPDGAVLVEDAPGVETEYEYVDGVQWDEGLLSPFLRREGETRVGLIEPRIFLTDYPLTSAEQLLPALEACVGAGERSLFVIAPECRDAALALLAVNRDRGVLDSVAVVRAPWRGAERTRGLEDIAVMTGGRCVRQDAGERIADVRLQDLGTARQAWATTSAFGILGGRGARSAIRQRLAEVKGELRLTGDDEHARDRIKARIGKLLGTVAVIRVGGASRNGQAELRLRVEAAVATARAAARAGVIPGGGAAFLACVPDLRALAASLTGEEALGARVLAAALAEPMRAIAENAGLDPGPVVVEACRRGPGWTFDAARREWVDAWDAGILDSLTVAETALAAGVSAATMALTTEVLVRHKQPVTAKQP